MDMYEKLEALEKQHEKLGAEIAELRSALAAEPEEWPQKGDKYYQISMTGGTCHNTFNDDNFDKCARAFGNFFRTQKEVEARAELLRWMTPALWRKIAVLREMEPFTTPCDRSERKYHLRFVVDGSIKIENYYGDFSVPVFASEERARECIAAIGEERLKRDWFGVTA